MFKKLSDKNNSIVFSWAVSYVSIILVFVVIFIIIFVNSFSMYKKEVNRSNEYVMEHTKNSLDKILNDVRKAATGIWLDNDIIHIFDFGETLGDKQYQEIYEITSKLNKIKSSTEAIDSIAVIDIKNNRVAATNGSADIETYYRVMFAEKDEDYQEFLNHFYDRSVEAYFTTAYNEGYYKGTRKITYMRSLSSADPRDLTKCVIITINEKHFLNQMNTIRNINKGELYIIDKSGQLMAATGGELYSEVNQALLNSNYGMFKQKIYGKSCIVSYRKSDESSWIYLNIIREGQYMYNIIYIQLVFSLGLILMIFLSGFLMKYFIKKNYYPVFALLNMFDRKGRASIDMNSNEFEVIGRKIKDTLQSNIDMDRQIFVQNHILRDRFIERLLKGQTNDDQLPISESLHLYDIVFQEEQFAVLLFFVEETGNLELENKNEEYSYNQTVFIVSNVVEELIARHHHGIMVECEGFIACIANINSERKDMAISDLIEAVDEAKQFIEDNFEIKFAVSISSVFSGLENAHMGYNEALDVMKHKQLLGIDKTMVFDEIKEINNSTYYYPFSVEQQFINLIRVGNCKEARELVYEVFQKNLKTREFTPTLAQYLMLNLTSTIIRTANELSGSLDQKFFDGINPMGKIMSSKSIDEMKSQLYLFLDSICEYILETREVKENWIKTDVLPYVSNNYKDFNLSVSQIAEKFGLHPVYVSRLFKEQMGEGLLEYISRFRIEKAKEIIQHTDQTLEEVAEAVGYANVRTFSRIFKKIERVTPGRYREMR